MKSTIPYISFGNKKKSVFLHGNGFPPEAYTSLLENLSEELNIYAMYQKPFSKTDINPDKMYGWDIFKNDFIRFLKEENFNEPIAIGHSMGAIIILLVEIARPNTFKKIFLLDPVITSPIKSIIYKQLLNMGLIDHLHPMIQRTNKKKMHYNNKEEIYNNYRLKSIFSKIDDKNLNYYINSIIEEREDSINIKLPKKWENAIYRNGSIHDYYIWKNIKKINTPTYILTPTNNEFGHFNYGNKLKSKNNLFKVLSIEDSTHLFPIEKPKETANLILSNINF